MITIGIDPGWSSFGIAINEDGILIANTSFVPKESITIEGFISELSKWITESLEEIDNIECDWNIKVYMERFVAYSGINASATEDILMLIGALDYYFSVAYSKPILVKAIDWKIALVHYLVKSKGLSNPYQSLDKKYSFWAAGNLSGIAVASISDHEADAVCLSYLTDEIFKVKR